MAQSMMSFSNQPKETIHSGQFMVSNFETKEDDEGIIIKELESDITNQTCMEIEKYRQTDKEKLSNKIDKDLTKLFNCMELTYSQKLTSPKWNHFKGIRLIWKDKIRLNNLIWRCWHIQFIMKNNNKKCQFASPIDVELQIKPEAIVLEGKYWKRNKTVVCAEYRKWRRYFKRNFIGNQNTIDTLSDIDFSTFWPPILKDSENDIDNICELLFSPIAFNDHREIERGTVRADFIQPSLEPLQPSLDDFLNPKSGFHVLYSDYGMLDQTDFFNSSRLPPVPEECADELFKNVDFHLMGSDQMDSTNINDITNQRNQVPAIIQNNHNTNNNNNNNSNNSNSNNNTIDTVNYAAKLYAQQAIDFGQNFVVDETMNNLNNDLQMDIVLDSYTNNSTESISPPPNLNNIMGGGKITYPKGRSPKTNFKSFNRREPPNYDKNQPTTHQTIMYNQLMAQQSQQQNLYNQQQQSTYHNNSSNNDINSLHSSPIQTTTNNYNNLINNISVASGGLNLIGLNNTSNIINLTNNQKFLNQTNMNLLTTQQQQQQKLTTMLSTSNNSSSPSSSLQLIQNNQEQQQQQHQQNQIDTTSYKPYHNPHLYKMNATQNYNSLPTPTRTQQFRHKSPPHNNLIEQTQQHQAQQQAKEMFRSNSLPINASLLLQKEETFVMPKYSGKLISGKPRTRSNSMIIKQQNILPVLQTATSEPMLPTSNSNSALLQQLLTTNTTNKYNSTSNVSQLFSSSIAPSSVQIQSPLFSNNLGSPSLFSPNPATTSTPSLSPDSILSLDSPMSPTRSSTGSLKYPRETQRRAGHIHAEKKRRGNIKHGFDALHSLIPQIQQSSSGKLSKAAMLQKGAEYIKQLRNERNSNNEQMEALKKERDNLSNSLNHLHSILPANGAPVSRQRTGRLKEMYNEYIHQRTLQNWKFWIFGLIFEPLLHSFNSTVSVASLDELKRTAQVWVDQHCSLVELRPAISNKLRYLSTTTDILSDPPSSIEEEVIKAISVYNNSNLQKQQQQQQQ